MYKILFYQKKVLEKGLVKPVNLIHGEEKFLIKGLIEKLRRIYKNNLQILWGDEIQMEDLFNAMSMGNVFLKPKEMVVVVLKAESFLGKLRSKKSVNTLKNTLQKQRSSKTFFVFDKKLSSQEISKEPVKSLCEIGDIILADKLSTDKIRDLLKRKFEREAGGIEEKALNLLMEKCGADLQVLRQEADKLIAYAQGNKITQEEVRKVCLSWEEESLFGYIDSLFEGNLDKALRSLKAVLREGVAPLQIQSLLINYALKLYIMHKLIERGINTEEALNTLGVKNSFLRNKFKSYLKTLQKNKIFKLLTALHTLDIQQKVYYINPETSLIKFTVDFFTKE